MFPSQNFPFKIFNQFQAVCVNSAGSFTCSCKNGFSGDGFTCVDDNECLSSNTCMDNSICTNTFGSFTCTCVAGYSMARNECIDIDECNRKFENMILFFMAYKF